jgi:hypothetical protein
MNITVTGPAGFAPTALFDPGAPPDVNYRATEITELERLKQRLLRARLADESNGELTVPLRRAANEAAALAWVTTHPLLVFPALFDEKARITRRQFERQLVVRARSRELMAA